MFKPAIDSRRFLGDYASAKPRLKAGLPHKVCPLWTMRLCCRTESLEHNNVRELMAEHLVEKLIVRICKQRVQSNTPAINPGAPQGRANTARKVNSDMRSQLRDSPQSQ